MQYVKYTVHSYIFISKDSIPNLFQTSFASLHHGNGDRGDCADRGQRTFLLPLICTFPYDGDIPLQLEEYAYCIIWYFFSFTNTEGDNSDHLCWTCVCRFINSRLLFGMFVFWIVEILHIYIKIQTL